MGLQKPMQDLFQKLIADIDSQILKVGDSQNELEAELDKFINSLESIKVDDGLTDQIIANAKRIANLKSRVTMCHNILNNSRDRCNRILAAAPNLTDVQST